MQQILEGAPFSMSEAASPEGRPSRSQTVVFSQLASGFVSSCDNAHNFGQVQLSGKSRRTLHVLGTQPKHLQKRRTASSHVLFWVVDVLSGIKRSGVTVIPFRVLQAFRKRALPGSTFFLDFFLRQLGNSVSFHIQQINALGWQRFACRSALVVDFLQSDQLVGAR